jgi:hypothetical protein
MPERVGAVVGGACLGVHALSMLLLQPVTAALFTPRVRDAVLAPHEPARAGPTLREAARCLRGTIASTLAVLGVFVAIATAVKAPQHYLAQRAGMFRDDATALTPVEMAVSLVLEIPAFFVFTLSMGRFVAYPSVVAMEPRGGFAALRRSAALTRPFRRTAATVLGLHLAARFAILWLFWLALAQLAGVSFLSVFDHSKDSIISDVGLLLIFVVQSVTWTFTFTAMALLYLNGRQMEGVTLDAMDDPDAPDEAARAATLSSRPPPRG